MGKVKTIPVKDKRLATQIVNGAELNTKIKLMESQFKAIKDELGDLEKGKYITEDGHTLTIAESPKYTDILPEEAKKALREKRLGKNFMSCVKVQIKALQRYLSDQEVGSLRNVVEYTRRYSFK